MEELVIQTIDGPAQPTPTKTNRGWFRVGDQRINREGRPKGTKAGFQDESAAVDRALKTDRVMRLILNGHDLTFRLTRQDAPWIVNLPPDAEIVACYVDVAKDAIAI